MKLTPVQLYTVNFHGDPNHYPADVVVWARSPEEAAAKFVQGDITPSYRMIHVMGTGLDFTYRIDCDPDQKLMYPPYAPSATETP